MNELFPIEEVKMDSPMLSWKKKHNVHTYYSAHQWTDPDWMPWCACFGEMDAGADPEDYGYGLNEEDAMRDLAYRNQVKCWNEE